MTSFLAPKTAASGAYLAPASPGSTTTPTPPTDSALPTMVGGVIVSVITSSSATLTWQAATDDIGVTGYEISVDTGTATWVDVGNVTTISVTGKVAATPYTARVRAYDASGKMATPITASFTTAQASTAPYVPESRTVNFDGGTNRVNF